MSTWRPMDTAPRDGTAFQAEIPGEGFDFIIRRATGFVDADGNGCAAWVIADDQEPPESWTDGVCWDENEDGLPSTQPARWKPLRQRREEA